MVGLGRGLRGREDLGVDFGVDARGGGGRWKELSRCGDLELAICLVRVNGGCPGCHLGLDFGGVFG